MEASGLKEGDKVKVKLIEIDKKTGKYRLSMRVLTPKPEGYVEREARPAAKTDHVAKVTEQASNATTSRWRQR